MSDPRWLAITPETLVPDLRFIGEGVRIYLCALDCLHWYQRPFSRWLINPRA